MKDQAKGDPLPLFVKKRRKEGKASEEKTHTEGMCGGGALAWDGGVSRPKGPGRQAGSIGGVRWLDETRNAGPRVY